MDSLVALILAWAIIMPGAILIYNYYRELMTGEGYLDYLVSLIPGISRRVTTIKKELHQDLRLRRIFKLVGLNLILNTLGSVYALVVYQQLRPNASELTYYLTIFLIFIVSLTFYGMGTYISSVSIEAFTKSDLYKLAGFNNQFRVTELFHRNISHLFIVSGWIGVMSILGCLDLFATHNRSAEQFLLIILGGGLSGLVSGLGQIVNKTALFQFPIGFGMFIIFYASLIIHPVALANHPVGSFAAALLAAYVLVLIVFILGKCVRKIV